MEYRYVDRNRPNGSDPIVTIDGVSVTLDDVGILKNVHLDIMAGETYALVGDRGSGKTTIGLLLSGHRKPDTGRLAIAGSTYRVLTPGRSRRLGIEMVYEDIHLLDYFSVAENLLLPSNLPRSWPFTDRRSLIHAAGSVLQRFGFRIDPAAVLAGLTQSEKMVVYILRSILREPRLLILDEALERLSAKNFERMLAILEDHKKRGMGILCITHRIDDIYTIADRVSILRNGEIILTDAINNIDRINLIKLCYSQISRDDYTENLNQEFYQLLRYNDAILRKLPVNLIVIDNDFRVKMINDFGRDYFHLESASFLNRPLFELLSRENGEMLRLVEMAVADRQEREFHQVPMFLDAEKRTVNVKVFPIFDGAFGIGNIIIVEDISEQEKLRQHAILSEKLASVGLLAAGVAHEINNPLAVIDNYLVSLEMRREIGSSAVIRDLKEEISSIKQIVSNLITFSDSNRQVIEVFDINEIVTTMLKLIRYNAHHKGITIRFETVGAYLPVRANKNEIKQVMLNLMKNSFEAMPNGGTVSIGTRNERNGDDSFVAVIIRDTGRGIDDADPNNVFLPFYSTKKGNGENLGLGLSVSYGIVRKYNGTISLISEKGKGTEFTVRFPIANESVR